MDLGTVYLQLPTEILELKAVENSNIGTGKRVLKTNYQTILKASNTVILKV